MFKINTAKSLRKFYCNYLENSTVLSKSYKSGFLNIYTSNSEKKKLRLFLPSLYKE